MDGKPACGVYEHVFKKLMMYVSDDDMGGSFTGPVDIAQLSGKPIQIDWATLDGVPAYSYISATGDRIYFASAKDKTGTMWNAPVVAAQGTSLHNLSLSGTGESFQIAYIDFGPGDTPNDRSLCFVRALNAAGSSWSAPIQIATGWNAGVECSLAAVEGNPAVAFHTEFLKSSNDDLYYIRALDQMGQLWGTPVLVDKPSASGWTPELSVVAGKPVISFIASAYYSNPEGGGAMYLAARDAAGVEWEEPYSVASAAGSDRISISNIMDVDGSPAVAVSRLLYTRDNYYTLNSSWNTEFLIWRD